MRRILASHILILLVGIAAPANYGIRSIRNTVASSQSARISKTDFDVIEGIFHDGLGTFAEVMLANELITQAEIVQPLFNSVRSREKMSDALNRLPSDDSRRLILFHEIANIELAVKEGARELLAATRPARLSRVKHTPREYADAHAADLVLEMESGSTVPVSVKTDKSHKVAIAEGQTPDIGEKWAKRFFRVSDSELNEMIGALGFSTMHELKADYLNVARLAAEIIKRKLGLTPNDAADFQHAKITDVSAVKFLFNQLRLFKGGKDHSRVIIFSRSTGAVEWESLLDEIDVESLAPERLTLLPSRARKGHPIASEFGLKIDGRTVVTFQVKHKRGRNRTTVHRQEFSDITTRLAIGTERRTSR